MFETSLFGPRVRLKHLVPFLRQAGTMLRAGIGIRQTFDTLGRGSPSRVLRQAIKRMSARVEAGDSLEEALLDAGPVFPPLMVRILVVGETSGGLDRMFTQLADYFEWWSRTIRGFFNFLIWPAVSFFFLVHVVALLMYLGWLGGNWAVLLLAFYIGVPMLLLLPKVLRMLLGDLRPLDYVLLKLPVFGKHVRTLLLARFSLALELLLEAGLGMDEALERAAEATGNVAFARGIRPAVARVMEGEGFAESLARTGMFPEMFLARMQTAEESGAVVEDLKRLADDYAEEARFAIGALTAAAAWGAYILMCAILIYYILVLGSQYASMIGGLAGGA